ncbi:8-amino-7-oxononanoate synthase [Alkalisalibacterium limincola]|uniref:8-amino-7-oxononanoate synthase n=1 Tax=Alkalisalibacterium limincola TaxID=2699169 RepID=A0A5C8KPU1_9GAMM|nr:8-amino-7-oxononanoate synthase [Alkalisalibacterium limincola]TXK62227.1 8-amino-7-oxononanoate synthase [Alkalisalibacterium limincola]
MARPSLQHRVTAAAAERESSLGVRRTRVVESREGARVRIDGQELLSFCGNDYLGLSQHLDGVAALQEAAAWHGVGSTGAHQVSGHHQLHSALEEEIAEWLGYPAALLLGSGFSANLAVLQTLLGGDDVCVQDRLNHASLIDAARLSGAKLRRYPHGDADAALRQLALDPDAAALLATDGVFSMDGDVAPLRLLGLAARSQNATLYVDDAHGVGVVGPQGRGCVAAAGLGVREVPLQLVTLGKALGGYGAVLVGSVEMIEHLRQSARPYRYTTALPPALAAASLALVRVARRESWRRAKLGALIARFRRGAQQLGVNLLPSTTPIQPLFTGDNAATLLAARRLEEVGILVAPIRPPTVPEGSGRLRITLSADHEEADIDRLLDGLALSVGTTNARVEAAHRLVNEPH